MLGSGYTECLKKQREVLFIRIVFYICGINLLPFKSFENLGAFILQCASYEFN